MTVAIYESEIREIAHFEAFDGTPYIIINQSYWYSGNEYTEEQAIAAYRKSKGI